MNEYSILGAAKGHAIMLKSDHFRVACMVAEALALQWGGTWSVYSGMERPYSVTVDINGRVV